MKEKIVINPDFYINYDRTDLEIEAFFLFCVCVAGKTAKTIAPKVSSFMNELHSGDEIKTIQEIVKMLKKHKMGKYILLTKFFNYIAMNKITAEKLRSMSIEELELVPGVGMKTSRYFKLGTDANVKCAAIDTHVLKFLRDFYHPHLEVPKSTPTSKKKYQELEKLFLEIYEIYKNDTSLANFDLRIWQYYSHKLQPNYENIHNYLGKIF